MLVLARQSEGNFTGLHDAGFAVLCASMMKRTYESTIDLCVRLSHEGDVGFLQVWIPQTSLHEQLKIHSFSWWHTSPFGSKEQLIMPYELSRVNTCTTSVRRFTPGSTINNRKQDSEGNPVFCSGRAAGS